MFEQILPNLYRAEIPLPRNPLKAVNSYLIKGDGRCLIIDTGMNREECSREMAAALQGMNIDLTKTDFFITHLHSDHLGLVGNLATPTSKVYFSKREASITSMSEAERDETRRQDSSLVYLAHGFPEGEIAGALGSHPGRLYGLKRRLTYTTVQEGDKIEIGDFSLQCIETPGHSPGHLCLYEPNQKLFFSGDHILLDISPNIVFWADLDDALQSYLTSLDKVYNFDVRLVLPGHRTLWKDHKQRIDELHAHHQARLNEILFSLEEGEKTAWEVAPHVSWDVDYKSWDLFPPSQKWFALGEVIAHLIYLERKEMIRGTLKGQKIVYSLA